MPAAPSQLYEFLASLRHPRGAFQPAGNQLLAAYELIAALADRAEWPEESEQWRTLLAPVLCSSPAQQEAFYSLFSQHFGESAAAERTNATTAAERPRNSLIPSRRALLVAIAVVVIAVGIVWMERQLRPPAAPKNTPTAVTPTKPAPEPTAESNILRIRVTGGNGLPVPDAKVQLLGREERTNSEGVLVTVVKNVTGNHYLLLTHPSFETRVQQIPARASEIAVQLVPWRVAPTETGWQGWFLRNLVFIKAAMVATPVLVLIVWLIRLWRKILEIRKWTTPMEPRMRQIGFDQVGGNLFHGADIRRLATMLRRRRAQPSDEIAPEPTAEACARSGGYFTPAFASRHLEPEYLAVIERKNLRDHQARLQDELFSRLRDHDVAIRRYYFQNSPLVCADGENQVFTLNELAALHPGHEAWIACEAATCVDPVSGEAEPWLDNLQPWSDRALLSFAGADAASLSRLLDLPVCPPTRSGLESLSSEAPPDAMAPLPELFIHRPGHWLDPSPPLDTESDRLIRELRRYAGENGFLCLQACALYPAIAWSITASVASELVPPDEVGGVLERLSSLPWFRHGTMPEWLRERLVRTLGDSEPRVRDALKKYLQTAVVESRRKEVQDLAPGPHRRGRGAASRDRIYLWFLSGRKLDKLSLEAPAGWRRLILAPLAVRVVAGLVAAAAVAAGLSYGAHLLSVRIHKEAPRPALPEQTAPGRLAAAMVAVGEGLASVPSPDSGIAHAGNISAIAADVLNVENPVPLATDAPTFVKEAAKIPGVRLSASPHTRGLIALGSRNAGLVRSMENGSVRLFGVDQAIPESEFNLGWVDFSGVVLRRANGEQAPGNLTSWVNQIDGQTYVYIPAGKFTMGCSTGDLECRDDERPAHEVKITRGFWIGQTEITQAAWTKIMKTNPSTFKGADRPVEGVSWDQARKFCEASGLRLPTEAEWEYAARGGSREARYGPLEKIAWYGDNSAETHPVAQKLPNALGLYDTLGNVWEWVNDWYGQYDSQPATNPGGPSSGQVRVVRGGSWVDDPLDVRASFRLNDVPTDRYNNIGFRCAGELR
ncbi:MAG: formylglycine-generating enzyme family protein [Bryobacteraceae bacterium]|nr:formylglycine-generating enzyme family protein [Bryobacteraceae bacterium]